jgi:glycosyltransferase involved in cell wall biosynthesis
MTSNPPVSIGLPVYNGENYLGEALDSLLQQTYPDFELILCDNASTDRTEEICRDFAARDARIRYHRQPENIGALANYNQAFESARGKYFKWAAHDDICAPEFLAVCVRELEEQPDVVLTYPKISYINDKGEYLRSSRGELSIRDAYPFQRLRKLIRLQIRSDDVFWAIFGLIRAEALRLTGGFGYYVASDQVLLMRLLLQGGFCEVPGKFFFRREHPQSSTMKLKSYRKREEWYNGRIRSRLVLPNCRLMKEHWAALNQSQLSGREKWVGRLLIAKRFAFRWRPLSRELASIPKQLIAP